MCAYSVNQTVKWSGDNYTQKYKITATHPGTDGPCTYDIQLLSDANVTETNIPEGNLRPVTA